MSKQAIGWIGALVVIVVAGIIALNLYRSPTPAPQVTQKLVTTPAPVSTVPPPVQHPISAVQSVPAMASTSALPPLEHSDALIAKALESLAGSKLLRSILIPHDLIPHIVATIDALPRPSMSESILPLRTPRGAFKVIQAHGQMQINPQNFARYAPYMRLIEVIDSKNLVAWYVHNYPLFQKAYRQLGYPKGYFNNRLIYVIDNLLTTPEVKLPILLQQPNVLYVYADPRLEALSAGQKMLLRSGPGNEAKIKAKLRNIRAVLTGQRLDTL